MSSALSSRARTRRIDILADQLERPSANHKPSTVAPDQLRILQLLEIVE
jgi:hypothetical protein